MSQDPLPNEERRAVPQRRLSATGRGRVPRIATKKLDKSYPGVHALNEVTLDVMPSEIRGIAGQNGAGKSTLIRLLAGAEMPDRGTIEIDGAALDIRGPHDAQDAGIFTIYQELSLVPQLTVAENIFLGDAPRLWGGVINWSALYREAAFHLEAIGFESIDVRKKAGRLSLAHQQAVEIAKVVRRDAKVVLLDEPTATLPPPDVERLLQLLGDLSRRDISLLYISHRLSEMYEICDTISVFRDGSLVSNFEGDVSNSVSIVKAMVGSAMAPGNEPHVAKSEGSPVGRRYGASFEDTGVVLEVSNLRDGANLHGVNLVLHEGEMLGVTGLAGNGQSELAAALFGAGPAVADIFRVNGEDVQIANPQSAVRRGVGLLPEERKTQGLVLDMPIASNITMAALPRFSSKGMLRHAEEYRVARQMKESLSIKVDRVTRAARTLSGGNQQKVVLAKWLVSGMDVLICSEPTRGVDVGAKSEIYQLLREFTNDGGSIILITSEVGEAVLCDRVVVIERGKIVGQVDAHELETEGEDAVLRFYHYKN